VEEAGDLPAFEPVYPLTRGLTQKQVAKAAAGAVARAPDLPEWIDPALKAREGWPDWRRRWRRPMRPNRAADLRPTRPRAAAGL
jgi:ATP-dependent DNA helicase RecG